VWLLLLDVVVSCVVGGLAAGLVAGILVPRLTLQGDYTAAMVGFLLITVGGMFITLRRWRRRVARGERFDG
jgi:predicted lipid-binding transport protein (Tim44 family)